jgi:hypothetical protein
MNKMLETLARILVVIFVLFLFYTVITTERVRYVWNTPPDMAPAETPIKQDAEQNAGQDTGQDTGDYHDITITYRWHKDGRIEVIDTRHESQSGTSYMGHVYQIVIPDDWETSPGVKRGE